ncbi:MAG: NYN domain-containing protein [Bryobacteraceae bacterium]
MGLPESFERAMQRAAVQPHYLRRSRWGEKGVDTALALEMQIAVMEGRIQVAVLVATDRAFVLAAQAVRRTGGRLVLVGLHLPHLYPRPVILSPDLTDAADRLISLTE